MTTTYRTYALGILSVAALCMLSGCIRKVRVTSNTFVDRAALTPKGFPLGSSFAVESLTNDNPLLAKEIAYKITDILEEKGYIVTQSEHADYLLQFDYGMSCSTKLVNVPTYIPGKVHIKNGHTIDDHGSPSHYQETVETVGSTVYVPQEYSLFNREIKLQVSRIQHAEPAQQVWQGTITSGGTCNDLREIVDYLLIYAFKHFGTSTKKIIHEAKTEWFKPDNDAY